MVVVYICAEVQSRLTLGHMNVYEWAVPYLSGRTFANACLLLYVIFQGLNIYVIPWRLAWIDNIS